MASDNTPTIRIAVNPNSPNAVGQGVNNVLRANGQIVEPSSNDPVDPKDSGLEYGAFGTNIFSGFITGEEYNNDLISKKGVLVFDQMRRSDATVRASLNIVKYPIMGVDWDIEPASDDPNDILIAEFVKDNLFNGEVSFNDFLRQALTYLDFGFSVFEKVYEPCQWAGNADGQGAGQYFMLRKLASRKQTTIQQWQLPDGKPGIVQIPPTGGTFNIPAEKLLIFTNEREGANYEGISLLRAAYKHWFIKDQLYKIMAIAVERQGLGVPYLIPPAQASEPDKILARDALKNLRANEQGYLEVPTGWEIGFLDMKANTTLDATPQIQHHDRQIMKNTLGQFLEMGGHSGSGGTQSSSGDQSRLYEQSLEAVARLFAEEVYNSVIKQLVDMNFTVKAYPALVHGRIADDNVAVLSDAMQKLGSAGFLTPTADTEVTVRKTLHLPELDEVILNDYNNRPKPAAQPVPGTPVDGITAKPTPVDNNNPDNLDQSGIDERFMASELSNLHKKVGVFLDEHSGS